MIRVNINMMLTRKQGGEKDGRNELKQQAQTFAPLSSFKSIDPRDSPDIRQSSEGR